MMTTQRRIAISTLIMLALTACSQNAKAVANRGPTPRRDAAARADGTVWMLDDLQLVDSNIYGVRPRSADTTASVYRHSSGATVRAIFAPHMLAAEAKGIPEGARSISAVGTGAIAVAPLGGSTGMSVTVSGAGNSNKAEAIASEFVKSVPDPAVLGFGADGEPATKVGAFDLVATTEAPATETDARSIQQRYRTESGADLTVRQERAGVGSLDLAAVPLTQPIEGDGTDGYVLQGPATGAAPVLMTMRDGVLITITGNVSSDELVNAANSLTATDDATWNEKVESTFADAVKESSADKIGGLAVHRGPQGTIACATSGGDLRNRCSWALSESPLIVAVPAGRSAKVVACLPATKVVGGTDVRVNGHAAKPTDAACGRLITTDVERGSELVIQAGASADGDDVEYRFTLPIG